MRSKEVLLPWFDDRRSQGNGDPLVGQLIEVGTEGLLVP